MNDRLQDITNSTVGGPIAKRLGIPAPPVLERHEPGRPVVDGPVVVGAAAGGRAVNQLRGVLASIGATVQDSRGEEDPRAAGLVFDATGIADSTELGSLYEFFHEHIGSLGHSARVIVLAAVPGEIAEPRAATAQRAIEGLTRSIAKEIGRSGSTAQLVRVAEGAEGSMESTLRFLLSPRSAYVDGQVVQIEVPPVAGDLVVPEDWERPLEGRVVAVTGAARGIGESIAETMASLGGEVVAIDIPAAGEALSEVANRIGGTSLDLDITGDDAPAKLADHFAGRQGRVDAFIHNAGITRDKTIKNMDRENWDAVLEVNLSSQERINDELLDRDLLGKGGRLISVSSVSGIAGNRGQTNYATTKAGVIGMVQAMAPSMRERHATINAVAPGFIETAMTAKMPLGTREAGRRTSSLLQGGQPVDVAETIGWLANPASAGVNGNVVRVCGQALIGA